MVAIFVTRWRYGSCLGHQVAGDSSHVGHQVEYSATGLLEKNRDRLAVEVVSMLRMSQIALVRTLFSSSIKKTGDDPLTVLTHHAPPSSSTQSPSPYLHVSTPSITLSSVKILLGGGWGLHPSCHRIFLNINRRADLTMWNQPLVTSS